MPPRLQPEAILTAIPLPAAFIGEGFRYIAANHPFDVLHRAPPAGMVGVEVQTAIGPGPWRRARGFHQLALHGEASTFESILDRECPLFLRVHLQPFPLEGHPHAYLTLLQDLTDCHRTEAALRSAELRGGRIIELSPDAIVISRIEDGTVLEVNGGFESITGIPRDRAVGRRVIDLGLWEDPDLRRRIVAEAQDKGEAKDIPVTIQRRDGTTVHMLFSAAVQEIDGEPLLFTYGRDLRELDTVYRKLRSTEDRYRALVDISPDAIWVHREGQVVFANAAAAELFRAPSPEGLVGIPVLDLVHPFDRPRMAERFQCLREGNRTLPTAEFTCLRLDGTSMDLEVAATAFTDVEGPAVLAIGRDVSRRKDSEAALRASEERFARTFHESPDAVVLSRLPDGRIVHVSNGFLEATGYTREEVMGRDAIELGLWVDPEARLELLWILREKGSVSHLPVRFRTKEGGIRHGLLAARLLDFAEERFLYAAVKDVTDRVLAEEALRESEERFSKAFQLSPHGLVITSLEDGRFLAVNDAFERIFGYAAAELLGRSSLELKMWKNGEDRNRMAHELKENGRVELPEVPFLRKDGGEGVAQFRAQLLDIQGRAHIIAIIQDITELRKQEEAHRHAQKLESLGLLAGGIAHDFNNLMQAILGNLNLAQAEAPPGSPVQNRLETMEKIVRRAESLVRQMLVYSGRGKITTELLDPNAMVGEIAELLKVSIAKTASLTVDLCPESVRLKADAAQLQQVILNLVTNASDALAGKPGSIRVRTFLMGAESMAGAREEGVVLQPLQEGKYLVVEVEDDGEGMGTDVLKKIFDPFFSTKAMGRGLGLSSILGIVRAHKGGLHVRSRPGEGSCFRVTFPLNQDPLPSVPLPTIPNLASSDAACILFADDEAEVRAATTAMMESMGHRVVQAADGQAALELFRENPQAFDLVLLDATMPRLGGIEALKAMQNLAPGIRAILCSGYSTYGQGFEPLNLGFADFLKKPFSRVELKQSLARVLGA